MIGQQEEQEAKDVEFLPKEDPTPPAPSDRFVFTLRFNAVEGGAIIERAGTLPGSNEVFVRKAVVPGKDGSRRFSLGVLRKAKSMLAEHLNEAFKED